MPTPVIVVPGIMGSRLALGDLCWDPDAPGAMLEWLGAGLDDKREALSVTDTTDTVLTELHGSFFEDLVTRTPREEVRAAGVTADLAEARGWAGPAWEFYGPALLDLHAHLEPGAEELPVFAFGYDWRRSNRTSGSALIGFTDAARATVGAEQAILVTHSMGGLVARAALASDPTFATRVRRVVHVGQPAEGTATLYRRFLTGVVAPYDDLAPLTETETWIQERVLARILGDTPEKFATLMSVVPGAMELLPSPRYGRGFVLPWLTDASGTDLGGDAVYETYRRIDGVGILGATPDPDVTAALAEQLDATQAFHQLVAGVSHPETCCIYGTGLRTDRYTRPGDPELVPVSPTGDGLVDEASANGASLAAATVQRSVAVPGVEHNLLLADPAVLAEVRRVVTGAAA